MELTPIDGSNVAAVGYLVVDRVLLVRYKDGGLYARAGVSPAEFEALMAAHSKGAWLFADQHPAVRIGSSPGMSAPECEKAVTSHFAPSNEAAKGEVLQTLDENASACCRRAFVCKWPKLFGQAACPICGMEFMPEMVGPVRHWKIKTHVMTFRR